MNTHTKDQDGNHYRLLNHGEIIQRGDQAYIPYIVTCEFTGERKPGFRSPHNCWIKINKGYSGDVYDARMSILRRKIIDAPHNED